MKIIVFDTETTGIPTADEDLRNQPHVCQFAGILLECDANSGNFSEIKRYDQLIKPPIAIPDECTAVHGITNQMVADQPIMAEEIENILNLFRDAHIAVAHNILFDQKLIEFELERLGRNKHFLPDQIFDTMKETKDLCKLPGRGDGYKSPRLQELYQFLFGKEFQNAHNAMNDVLATAICLKELFDRDIFKPEEPAQSALF